MKITVLKTSCPVVPTWLIGEWMEVNGESSARFKIAIKEKVKTFDILVEGYDSSDCEIIEIKDISYTNKTLKFSSIVPSTNFIGHHQFMPGEKDGVVKHVFTFEECWIRKKAHLSTLKLLPKKHVPHL